MSDRMQELGKAMEEKFFHSKEQEFRIVSRRRKLLALWAADLAGKDDEEALEYALDIIRHGMQDATEGAVVTKIIEDLEEAGISTTEAKIRAHMEEFHRAAIQEIEEGK